MIMTYKQYKSLRKDLETLKGLIGKAYNKSNDISLLKLNDADKSEIWDKVHNITGKLWESYCAIDNEIIKLDKSINDNQPTEV